MLLRGDKLGISILARDPQNLRNSDSPLVFKGDYKRKIRTKLKEWKYDGFSEDDEIDGRVHTRDNK